LGKKGRQKFLGKKKFEKKGGNDKRAQLNLRGGERLQETRTKCGVQKANIKKNVARGGSMDMRKKVEAKSWREKAGGLQKNVTGVKNPRKGKTLKKGGGRRGHPKTFHQESNTSQKKREGIKKIRNQTNTFGT